MAVTTNYSWTKPIVAGDSGTWGTTLNTDLDSIDTTVKTVSDAVVTAQAAANTAIAGNLNLTPVVATVTGAAPTFATTINLSTGAIFTAAVNIGATSSTFDVTFTNRQAVTSKFVWVHCSITASGGAVKTFTFRVAAASGQYALPFTHEFGTSGIDTVYIASVIGNAQLVIPLYIVGS